MNPTAAKQRRVAPEWRWVYSVIVVMFVGMWMFTLSKWFSPIITYAMLLVLLRPFAGTRRHRIIVVVTSVVMVLWLLSALGSILAPFIVAFAIAYILDPAADWLERKGLPRWAAVAIITIPIFGSMALGLVFGLPALVSQLETLLGRLPEALQTMATSLEKLRIKVANTHLPFLQGDQVAAQLTIDQAKVTAFIQKQQTEIATRAWHTVLGVGRGLSFLLTMIGYLVLTPVLIIYLLKDFDSMAARVRGLMPVRQRDRWVAFMTEFDDLLSRFLRGQVIEAILVGILTWLGLMLLGVPYSGLVGTVAGIFNLIPYLGLVVSIIPVVIIAVLSGNFVSVLARSGIVFFIVQLIDGAITGPRIVGGSIGIHPVIVILSLAVGSFFFGFVGLLLALPAAILVKLLLRNGIARYRLSPLYLGGPVADDQ